MIIVIITLALFGAAASSNLEAITKPEPQATKVIIVKEFN